MEWWWYPLIAFGVLVVIAVLFVIFGRDNGPAFKPMGGRYALRQPEHPTPKRRKGWRITIERN